MLILNEKLFQFKKFIFACVHFEKKKQKMKMWSFSAVYKFSVEWNNIFNVYNLIHLTSQIVF